MKTLTISLADDVYQRAVEKAAAAETPLPKVVHDLVSAWTGTGLSSAGEKETQRHAEFLRFLDELAARPTQPGPSVGPLNREELYQRGIPGY
jgi:hypothetical protein